MQVSELIQAHLMSLFAYNSDGRMVGTNELSPRPAPRFFLVLGEHEKSWRLRHDLAPSLAARLELLVRYLQAGKFLTEEEPGGFAAIRAELTTAGDELQEQSGPAYHFPAAIAQDGDAIEITPANVELTRRSFPWLASELRANSPVYAVVREGVAVALCHCARLPGTAVEAGVTTLENYRCKGYASQAVAAWAGAVRRAGRVPLYSTAWPNRASQGVARRLGLVQYAVDYSLG